MPLSLFHWLLYRYPYYYYHHRTFFFVFPLFAATFYNSSNLCFQLSAPLIISDLYFSTFSYFYLSVSSLLLCSCTMRVLIFLFHFFFFNNFPLKQHHLPKFWSSFCDNYNSPYGDRSSQLYLHVSWWTDLRDQINKFLYL